MTAASLIPALGARLSRPLGAVSMACAVDLTAVRLLSRLSTEPLP